ncbi:hypothetical protein ACHAXA_010314 [Cyclostephanos tholiformis]|uniref:Uncharacterized protein n=1 Tax=Cyclostephanos tholiformis TaxID=382380 RepID=A0ABD3RF88_9STRA
MAKPIFLFATIIFVCHRFQVASTFSIDWPNAARARRPTNTAGGNGVTYSSPPPPPPPIDAEEFDQIATAIESTSVRIVGAIGDAMNDIQRALLSGCMMLAAIMTTTPLASIAAESIGDELEIAELPPVYVPIIFAIGVIGGVGVLTASLGNVMDEEASLGLQSGARAKKERDRTRSSYFKK